MKLQELYRLIGLSSEAIAVLDRVGGEIDRAQARPYLDQLLDIQTAPSAYRQLSTLLKEDPDGFKLLFCYLECARRAYDGYQKLHIPDQIYLDTMKCFPRFLAECRKEIGALAFDRGWWAYRQTSMQLFRIGTLEYEFHSLDGEPVIALHIPSDAQLTTQAVDRSLEQAERFFQTFYPSFCYDMYTCNSWLLSPRLRPLLARESRILAFQDRFHIRKDDPTDREYIQWLFQVPQNTAPANLPAGTSLQKGVRQLLLNGGTVGCTCGIIERRQPPSLPAT